jgi:hypothetical protein
MNWWPRRQDWAAVSTPTADTRHNTSAPHCFPIPANNNECRGAENKKVPSPGTRALERNVPAARKPNSVPLPGAKGGDHFSRPRVAARLQQPTRGSSGAREGAGGSSRAGTVRLFGLAAGGVCRATGVTTRAVRSYRTISPLPSQGASTLGLGGIFLLHFPSGCPAWTLSSTVPCAVRTFLAGPTFRKSRRGRRCCRNDINNTLSRAKVRPTGALPVPKAVRI